MKTIQVTFLISTFCFMGCTSTHRLRPGHEADYASFNKQAVGMQAKVTFVDGRKINVVNLFMTADSIYWSDTNKIATAQIKEVRYKAPGVRAKRWSLDKDTDQADLYEEINKRTRGRSAVLILKDGQALQVRQLSMTPDFTYWIDQQIKQQASSAYIAVATSQIKEVRFFSRGSGAMQGILYGALYGTLGGLIAVDDCSNCLIPPEAVAAGFGIWGVMIGAPVGAIIGHRDVYLIENETATGTN